MIVIDVGDLGIPTDARPFAEGAVGELFHVPARVASLPGRTLVFKKIKAQVPSGDRQRILDQMRSVVAMRDTMTAAELAELDDVSVWPLAVVRQGGGDVGILLDHIADEFFVETHLPDGTAGKTLFELQFFSVSDGYFGRMGIDPAVTGDDVMRLALMARLAYAIEVVHRRPVVFGDLHAKNAVASAHPFARVLLMDCDSAADLSDPDRIQLHGPFFMPPEIRARKQKLQDQATDVYKLGLCIVRALSRGRGATQEVDPANANAIPGLLDQTGIDIIRRAVGDDRDRRPTAAELRGYLAQRLRSLIQLPELLSAELSHRVILRGGNVMVRWRQLHGTEVRIYGLNGFSVDGVDPNVHAAGYAIAPTTSGPIDVEVWNRHGPSERVRAGHVDYYELPSLDLTQQVGWLPRPVVPEVPALDAQVFTHLRPYPTAVYPNVVVETSAPQLSYPAVVIRHPPVSIDLGRGVPRFRFHAGPMAAVERAQVAANKIVGLAVGGTIRRMTRMLHRQLAAGRRARVRELEQRRSRSLPSP